MHSVSNTRKRLSTHGGVRDLTPGQVTKAGVFDYQSVSEALKDKIEDAGQYNDAVHSDHCPVWLRIGV